MEGLDGHPGPGPLLQHEASVLPCPGGPPCLAGLPLLGRRPGVCGGSRSTRSRCSCGTRHSSPLQARGPPCPLVPLRGGSPSHILSHSLPLSFKDTQPSAHQNPPLAGCVALGRCSNLTGSGLTQNRFRKDLRLNRLSMNQSASRPHFLLIVPLPHCPLIPRTDRWTDGTGRLLLQGSGDLGLT